MLMYIRLSHQTADAASDVKARGHGSIEKLSAGWTAPQVKGIEEQCWTELFPSKILTSLVGLSPLVDSKLNDRLLSTPKSRIVKQKEYCAIKPRGRL